MNTIHFMLITLAGFVSCFATEEDGSSGGAIKLQNEVCLNSETTVPEFQASYNQWKQQDSSCYSFSYTFLGYSVPSVESRTVVNGKAVGLTDYQKEMWYHTIEDFYSMIDQLCVRNCPRTNASAPAAHRCNITYSTTGSLTYPSSIFIDVNQIMADEERVYRLDNVTLLSGEKCPGDTSSLVDPEEPTEPSTESENKETKKSDLCKNGSKENWEKAKKLFEVQAGVATGCYDFTVERLGRIVDAFHGPFQISVRNGVASELSGFTGANMSWTIGDWFQSLYDRCWKGCETESGPASYSCSVAYNKTNGYPENIFIDPSKMIADEELYYKIYGFAPCTKDDGNTESGPGSGVSSGTCVGYEQVQQDLTAARQLWSGVSCYDYTLQVGGSVPPSGRGPFVVSVRNDQVVPNSNSAIKRLTVSEMFGHIEQTCLSGCPKSTSAAYQCIITYADDGSPSHISINFDNRVSDEETRWTISNVSVCADPTPENENSCANNTGTAQKLEAAKAKWTEPKCYNFTVQQTLPSLMGTMSVQVRNGVITSDSSSMNKTIEGLLDMLHGQCTAPCQNGTSGVGISCQVKYDDSTGQPTGITIQDADSKTVSYIISPIVLVDCESVTTALDDRKIVSGTNQRSVFSLSLALPATVLAVLC